MRKILKELDGIELVYEKGCFRFTLSSVFYCDYLRFMAIVAENRVEDCRQEFLHIVGRGKFVGFMDDPLFDGFKQDVECRLEVLVLQLMKEAFEAQDYSEAMSLAEAEFNIDPVNETALSCCIKSLFMLKHENAAIGTYQRFVAEYKNIRGKITLLLSAFIGISFPDMLHPVFSVFVFSFIFQSAFLEFLWFFLYAIEKYL